MSDAAPAPRDRKVVLFLATLVVAVLVVNVVSALVPGMDGALASAPVVVLYSVLGTALVLVRSMRRRYPIACWSGPAAGLAAGRLGDATNLGVRVDEDRHIGVLGDRRHRCRGRRTGVPERRSSGCARRRPRATGVGSRSR